MLTYSINVGSVTESKSLDLSSILNQLPDNSTHLIKPGDVRDAIFTTWTSGGIFKLTSISASNVEYIGLGSDETGVLTTDKIFLGKRKINGSDVLNNNILNSDADIIFFNNKSNSSDQSTTKLLLLAGTMSSVYDTYSPYISAVSNFNGLLTPTKFIDLNIVSPSGSVFISSGGTSSSNGRNVTINGVSFPTIYQNTLAEDGQVLKFYGGELVWSDVQSQTINGFTSSGTFSIVGSPILLNGSPTTYTNSDPIITTLGGISAGTTFSDVSFFDMFTSLLYPYVASVVSLSLTASSTLSNSLSGNNTNYLVAEYGSINSINYSYSISQKSKNVTQILSPSISDSWRGSSPPQTYRLTGTSSIFPIPTTTSSYLLSVTDGTGTASTTANLKIVYPYFYGLSSNAIGFSASISTLGLTKITKEKSNTSVSLSGNNKKIYFMYPSSYGSLTQIIDTSTGYDYLSSFTLSVVVLSSSSPLWSNVSYNVYEYTAGDGYTSVSSTFTFKH